MDDSNQLTEQLKSALRAAWARGQRELVLLTFKAATAAGHNSVARWIHSEFEHHLTTAELKDLIEFAVELRTARAAAAILAITDREHQTYAETAAKAVIARAMQH